MKIWYVAAGGIGLVAAWYLWRTSNNGAIVRVAPIPIPVATGPTVESASGRGHFVRPYIAAGPSTEAIGGRGHF